jgi:hypothetical protein
LHRLGDGFGIPVVVRMMVSSSHVRLLSRF